MPRSVVHIGPCSHGNNSLTCVKCKHARQKNLASFQGSVASAGKAIGKLGNHLSNSSDGLSLDFDQVAEELRKRQPPYVSLADGLKPLRKPAKGGVLVLQTDQHPAAFLEALHLVWPGVPVLVLPSDSKLTVQLVSSLIDKLKALAARNELQRYDP